MKSIYSLIPDIQELLTKRDWLTTDLSEEFGRTVARRLGEQFTPRNAKPTLRLSRMGPQCPCALWHSIHKPELEEKLPPWAENKFSFGHIAEAWGITLARAAGHTVTGEQDEVSVDGIIGHRDCVIDGHIVDIKCVHSRGFKKWKTGFNGEADDWGYLSQLDGYIWGSREDPLVLNKEKGFLFVIDRELGHMVLYPHTLREQHIRKRVAEYKEIVALPSPPKCTCKVSFDGKLMYPSTYNNFKKACFPNLRVEVTPKGPIYIVK
jgi:hypothetical protein